MLLLHGLLICKDMVHPLHTQPLKFLVLIVPFLMEDIDYAIQREGFMQLYAVSAELVAYRGDEELDDVMCHMRWV